jgi:thiamine pyrophosphate-dependent acetolactate synthase large subunit-like protein
MHATMAVFNAWCDRMPLLLIGATGPMDAAERRPWIEWIHTARDQGAMLRHYTKWDDQPASPAAARESVFRAGWIAQTAPKGPVYINLDVGLQEAPLQAPLPPVDARRYMPAIAASASAQQIAEVARQLSCARRPVILAGRVSRDEAAWAARVQLAQAFEARVVTDLKVGAAFPTRHPLHAGAPGIYLSPDAREAIAQADLVLSLDWVDLAGTLSAAFGPGDPPAQVIHVSLDHTLHNGWSMDHQGLPAVDMMLAADPDQVALALAASGPPAPSTGWPAKAAFQGPELATGPITMAHLATGLKAAVAERPVSLVHLPLGWDGRYWDFGHPLDFLGSDGGGGIGGGPGIAVGAALALKGSGRTAVCVGGDGDFLMGATAIWTAAHYRIPLLYIVANNQSFFNDEVHQERVARMRGRPVENKWIGQRIDDPAVDIAAMARAQGALGIGPVRSADELEAALREALAHVDAGGIAVVDVITEPGYTPAMVAALNNAKGSTP